MAGTDCYSGTCEDGRCIVGAVFTGWAHTCTLFDEGRVRCWGEAGWGRLGYSNQDDIGDDELPFVADDVNVGGAVIQLALGGAHTCALLDTGAIYCWGYGDYGQLGYGNDDNIGDYDKPASAGSMTLYDEAFQLIAGLYHTCALMASHDVYCWGYNDEGQLGYGHNQRIGENEPVYLSQPVNIGGRVTRLAAGANHTCALLDTGAVRCWGDNTYGQLGYGHTDHIGDDESPADVGDVELGGTVIQMALGPYHTCVLLSNEKVKCWGYGGYGQLGYGNTDSIGDNELPSAVSTVDVGGTVKQIVAGERHTCAVLEEGAVRCWGDAQYLGYGDILYGGIGDDEAPAAARHVPVGGPVHRLTTAYRHTCALMKAGAIRCWGDNKYGQLGYGNKTFIGYTEPASSGGDVQFLESSD